MPQLDSLRAFAVGGVLVTHLYGLRYLPFGVGKLDWGHLGVSLFFVISGFLISTILLRYRDLAENGSLPKERFVRLFYARRALRIFPLYYLVVVVAFVLDLPLVREAILWLATYTTNLYIASHENWVGPMGHLWTLAVEEQFYFLWPWLVIFLPRRSLIPVTLAGIAAAPLVRALLVLTYPEDVLTGPAFTLTHTAAQLDMLGVGALLAMVTRSDVGHRWAAASMRTVTVVALAASAVLQVLLVLGVGRALHVVFFDLSSAVVFAGIIAAAARGIRGPVGSALTWRPLRHVGRISYGVYVYHNFVPAAFDAYGVTFQHRSIRFLICTSLTLAVASISWHFFERPLNRMKARIAPEAAPPGTMSVQSAPV